MSYLWTQDIRTLEPLTLNLWTLERAALDSAEPFGPEPTADGLVACCGCQKPDTLKS